MSRLTINRLISGGLITNYYCTSQCAHCLYCCSPRREKQYIDPDTARANLERIKGLGCRAVHVGGGEPLLNPEGLFPVLEAAHKSGVGIDYVETNSSWFQDPDSAAALLTGLKRLGVITLLISISPFHNEYIPFYKVKGVINACRRTGMNAFPWINEFYREIDALADRSPHRLAEYREKYGEDYLRRIPSRYWVHFGGRALATFAPVLGTKDYAAILKGAPPACRELQDVKHFHLDLFGNFIPGLCAGLAIRREDLGRPLAPEKYPLLTTLFSKGVRGLFELSAREHGFQPAPEYLNRCHLCQEIRRYLAMEQKLDSPELQPRGFYAE